MKPKEWPTDTFLFWSIIAFVVFCCLIGVIAALLGATQLAGIVLFIAIVVMALITVLGVFGFIYVMIRNRK